MAKTNHRLETKDKMKPHATKKSGKAKTNVKMPTISAVSGNAGNKSAKGKTIAILKSRRLVSSDGGNTSVGRKGQNVGDYQSSIASADSTKSAGRKSARNVSLSSSTMRSSGSTKRASGKTTNALTTTGSLSSAGTPFPLELLSEYRVYRQLQTAMVRLTNQIKAIQKHDKLHAALSPLKQIEMFGRTFYKSSDKAIKAAVRTLPIWDWAQDVRGLAENSLGQLLGETGDLSNYANPAKLWSRMELGIFKGHRQQLWSKTRKGFTKKENEDMAGMMHYGGRRRALMHVIGSNLIRAKNPIYSKIYNDRKAYDFAKLPERLPDGKKNKSRKSHAHKRAMRYMEKRFLLDLWKAWRGLDSIANQEWHVTVPSTKKDANDPS